MSKKNSNKNSAINKTENIANDTNANQNAFITDEHLINENERESKAENKRLENLKRDKLKQEKKLLAIKTKQERLKARNQQRVDKQIIKQEKRQEKQRQKQEKQAYRRDNGKNKRGIGGFVTAIVSLGVSVLVLGGLLAYTVFSPVDDYINMSANEERNFYDLVGYVDNIDTNLSKVLVSNDDENIQKMLGEVRLQSNLASESLANLSLHDEEKFYTVKFINQVGDYSKYLNNKLISGQSLNEQDLKTLNEMYKINKTLKQELSTLASNINEDFEFKSIYEDKKDNLIISKFIQLEESSVDYPHMIYDGAFSDGTESSKAKALEGLKEIKKIEAEEIFKKAFKSYGVKNVELTGETTDKVIETYNFDGELSDGTLISATISKKGGKIINFNNFREAEEVKYTQNDCQSIASNFIESLGIKGMKAVWMTEGTSVDTFNFAYVLNGVVCYPDLIKVNVCRERGIVCSMEAKSYYLNHYDRELPSVTTTTKDAQSKVSSKIDVDTSRLAVIPRLNGAELLAYEFTGEYNEETYYVYIDAVTLKEVDIFKVVKTTEGDLLL